MGTLYQILPLDDAVRSALREWPETFGNLDAPDGRWPRREDFEQALKAMPWLEIDQPAQPAPQEDWTATLSHRNPRVPDWAALRFSNVLYFEAGFASVMHEVLFALTFSCGSLVLWPDSGEAPLLVPAIAPFTEFTVFGDGSSLPKLPPRVAVISFQDRALSSLGVMEFGDFGGQTDNAENLESLIPVALAQVRKVAPHIVRRKRLTQLVCPPELAGQIVWRNCDPSDHGAQM